MEKSFEEIVQELRSVGKKLNVVIEKLRFLQESKLNKTVDDDDLKEIRTIKEIIYQLERVP